MFFAGWEILANAGDPGAVLEMGEVEAVARTLGIEVATFHIQRAEDIEATLEAFKDQVQAIYVVADPLVFTPRARNEHIGDGWAPTHDARRSRVRGSRRFDVDGRTSNSETRCGAV